jgi:hypothetical protein
MAQVPGFFSSALQNFPGRFPVLHPASPPFSGKFFPFGRKNILVHKKAVAI